MAQTFLNVIAMLIWPLALAAAAWIVVLKAFAETDDVSKVVEALTRPDATADKEHVTPLSQTDGRQPGHVSLWFAALTERARRRASDKRGHQQPASIASTSARIAVLLLLTTVLVLSSTPEAQARRYEFDQRRTEVRFVYKMAYSTQRGRFTKVHGTLDYDEASPEKSKISASIAAASLTTGEAIVDNELKGSSFFNVEASPVIAFKSLIVRPNSATSADVSGEITLKGITKPVTLKVSLEPHDDPALKHDEGARKFLAKTRIQRSAFDMTDYQSMVDDEIDIEIDAIVRPR